MYLHVSVCGCVCLCILGHVCMCLRLPPPCLHLLAPDCAYPLVSAYATWVFYSVFPVLPGIVCGLAMTRSPAEAYLFPYVTGPHLTCFLSLLNCQLRSDWSEASLTKVACSPQKCTIFGGDSVSANIHTPSPTAPAHTGTSYTPSLAVHDQ